MPKEQQGFTLIEVLFSVFIITVCIIALYNGLTFAINATNKAERQFQAVYLAQEGIEIAKNIRDSNWINGDAWTSGLVDDIDCATVGCEADYSQQALTSLASLANANYLYIDDADGFYKYISSPGSGDVRTPYKRVIKISKPYDYMLSIETTVYWDNDTVVVKENIYDWK